MCGEQPTTNGTTTARPTTERPTVTCVYFLLDRNKAATCLIEPIGKAATILMKRNWLGHVTSLMARPCHGLAVSWRDHVTSLMARPCHKLHHQAIIDWLNQAFCGLAYRKCKEHRQGIWLDRNKAATCDQAKHYQ